MVRTTALAVLIATFLSAGAAVAAAAEIQVCEHKNYAGRCVTLLHGVNDLRDWGMSNTISSFRIRSGTWRMCTAPNLQGACQDFTRSVSDLAGTRLQDAVSSLRPVRSGSGGGGTAIVVYTAPNFRGRSLVFSDDISDLRRVGLNDRISSVRVLGGRWVICTDINYVGCRSIAADVPDLGAIGWDGRISSIREGQNWWNAGGGSRGYGSGYESGGRSGYPGGGGTAIVVYTAPNFRGRSLVFSDDISDLRRVNLNDRIASVRVLGGRWVLCTDINYVGCRSVAADIPDLDAIGWGGRVSSIREGQNWWNAGGGSRGYGGGYEGGRPGGTGGGYGQRGNENLVPTLTLFLEPNFRGRSYQTQREIRNLVDVGFNDMAASIRVSGGRWQVCTDKNFQGQCLVITRDTNELATNFMRQISSIRPY